jgi:hypothetical protein
VSGDGIPSSINVIEGGYVIGQNNGTILQLLPYAASQPTSTLHFTNGDKLDMEMFGHVSADPRIRTIWAANNRRESVFAVKLGSGVDIQSPTCGSIERVVEFGGLKNILSFCTLPHDLEAAFVGFYLHRTGADQIIIRKDTFTSALESVSSKFPVPNDPELGDSSEPLKQDDSEPSTPRTPPPLPDVEKDTKNEENHLKDLGLPSPSVFGPSADKKELEVVTADDKVLLKVYWHSVPTILMPTSLLEHRWCSCIDQKAQTAQLRSNTRGSIRWCEFLLSLIRDFLYPDPFQPDRTGLIYTEPVFPTEQQNTGCCCMLQ